eukprot:scaffold22619_cov29-Tisochrysis_lutea.AAC.1
MGMGGWGAYLPSRKIAKEQGKTKSKSVRAIGSRAPDLHLVTRVGGGVTRGAPHAHAPHNAHRVHTAALAFGLGHRGVRPDQPQPDPPLAGCSQLAGIRNREESPALVLDNGLCLLDAGAVDAWLASANVQAALASQLAARLASYC